MTTTATRSARRLLSRSRSVWAAVAVVVAAAAAAWIAVEAVRFALGLPAFVASPLTMLEVLASGSTAGLLAGAAGAVFGLVCLWGALSPGRTGRRIVWDDRAPIVVDDGVLAGALSRDAAGTAAVSPLQVGTRVSRRQAAIEVVPSSGFPVDAGAVERRAADAVAALGPVPVPRVRVRVAEGGVLS